MPRRKPKSDRILQETLKKSLEDLLDDTTHVVVETINDDQNIPALRTSNPMDVTTLRLEADADAKMMMESLMDFYLSKDIITNKEYARFREKMDTMNISSMMMQLKTAQHIVNRTIEEIDSGSINPKMIEVFCQLQTQLSQIPKNYNDYLMKMEDSYKKLQVDSDIKDQRGETFETSNGSVNIPENVQEQTDGVKTRGTKALMESLMSIYGKNKITDSELEIISQDIIDPNIKASNIDLGDGGEEENDIEEDYFK